MKIHVKAKASDFKFATWTEADDCIEKHKKYGVKCEMQRNWGFLSNTYDLCMEGTEENLNDFLSFLRMKGFKIKKF